MVLWLLASLGKICIDTQEKALSVPKVLVLFGIFIVAKIIRF
jgi:hypothetical protein